MDTIRYSNLADRLQLFLAKQEKYQGDSHKISEEDMDEFRYIIEEIRDMRWEPDPCGPSQVELQINDRRKLHMPYFFATPHHVYELPEKEFFRAMDLMAVNIKTASEHFERSWSGRRFWKQENKD